MRSTAVALETYYFDNAYYPTTCTLSIYAEKPSTFAKVHGDTYCSIYPGKGNPLFGITTPIPYLSSLYFDPFQPAKERIPFAYYADLNGWILISPGPDGDYDIIPRKDYTSKIAQPSSAILVKSYDPTNGRLSDGDIWRVKQ
jgi:hypothetical protein